MQIGHKCWVWCKVVVSFLWEKKAVITEFITLPNVSQKICNSCDNYWQKSLPRTSDAAMFHLYRSSHQRQVCMGKYKDPLEQ